MDLRSVEKAYRRLAGTYDTVFGPFFHPGHKTVVNNLDLNPGDKVLEMGVGTGLSLPLYPRDVEIHGIDVSGPMLQKARDKRIRDHLENVKSLDIMDAENTSYADDTFDVVVASYVVTVVPNPLQCIDEMRRVCKPDGELVIVNHFHSDNALLAGFEKALAPLSKTVGFRPNMRESDLVRDARLDVIERRNVLLLGYWKMLKCRNNKTELASNT